MPHANKPYTVALTGGIASGKTLISDEFARLGVPVIDTDVIAHALVEPGQPTLKEIENKFGPGVIDAHGRLERRKLRSLIFANTDKRRQLEAIMHPKIRHKAGELVAEVTSVYCILVIPLLGEREAYPNVDRILVVDVDPETQIKRLMARDNCSREQAEQALASQPSRNQRIRIADDIINNVGSKIQSQHKVKRLHKVYCRLSQNQ